MSLDDLKITIAAYLGKNPQDLTKGGVDLILVALNNAKRTAQLVHDFNAQKVVAEIAVTEASGGLLSNAVYRGTSTAVNLKEAVTFYEETEDGDLPLYHSPKKNAAAQAKLKLRARNTLDATYRYPSDDMGFTIRTPYGHREVLLYGDTVTTTPGFTGNLIVDGIFWLPDYATGVSDWMLETASDYLMYAAICELNNLTLTFVPNLDGNLGPPTKARDQALDRLITQDIFKEEQGRQHNSVIR
jgi:hypothetical protein